MIRDKNGFTRHLTYDELLAREKQEERAEFTNPGPGVYREATRLVLSPMMGKGSMKAWRKSPALVSLSFHTKR